MNSPDHPAAAKVDSPQFLYDSGLKALKKSDLANAERYFAAAIAAREDFVAAWIQLGITWDKSNRLQEATDAFRMAVHLEPHNVDALYNLGIALSKSGHEEEALKYFSDAATKSDTPQIAKQLGLTYYNSKDYKNAAFFLLKAYIKSPKDPEIITVLATCLIQNDETTQAVLMLRNLILDNPKNHAYVEQFVNSTTKWAQKEFDPKTKSAVEIALKFSNIRHKNLSNLWGNLLLKDPEFALLKNAEGKYFEENEVNRENLFKVFKSDFLLLGLSSIQVTNAFFESIFTKIRKYFLIHWNESSSWPREALHFLMALGIQCFYNDYVYFQEPVEKEAISILSTHLRRRIQTQKSLTENDTKLLALLSCYQPLYEMDFLTAKPALPPAIKKSAQLWMRVQYLNPLAERALIPTIPSFTKIEDQTSLDVQKMYEQRPYPRWTSLGSAKTSQRLRDISENLDILVAGCGTGQEPCLYANLLPHARITAIDLSRSSIAYGMRMAEELGFRDRIRFLHGDLMKVIELGKQFDYVVSSGVLHHLKEPEKGFAAILSTLKPTGKMSIMLYSKIARDKLLNAAISYIHEKKYSSSGDDIRQFRQDILKMPTSDPRAWCAQTGDFFSLFECNDLLFHVQEHRYTFPMIGDLAARHNMRIFHVGLSPQRRKEFAQEFPKGEITDMATMNQFELNHPEAFGEMYKIYLTRSANTAPHPLDQLIEIGAV